MKAGHEKDFCPARTVTHAKVRHASSFTYMEAPPAKKKVYRDSEGEVQIGPVNFLTMPMKKGRV